MISVPSVLAAIFLFLSAGYVVGYPLSRHLDIYPPRRLLIAPILGLSIYAGVCALAFRLLPFNAVSVASVFLVVAIFASLGSRSKVGEAIFPHSAGPPLGAIVAAIGVAALPAFTVMPHLAGGSVSFGTPIFDHLKVAIVNELADNGNPPHNPFVSFTGAGNALNYYYLWYLLAAAGSITTGASGWATDVALTFVTALASILTIIWLATGYSGKKTAAWWVIATCLIGSTDAMLHEHTLEPWLIQASWVPQHVFAATAAIIAILLIAKLFTVRSPDPVLSLLIGILAAAVYASSVWVAVGFVSIVIVLATVCIRRIIDSRNLGPLMLNTAIVVATAAGTASPFLIQQLSLVGKAHLVALWIFPVFQTYWFVNPAAYWLLMLPLDFGFIYLAWILGKIARATGGGDTPSVPVYVERALTAIVLVPLIAAQLFHSVIANDDFGWRIIIPAVLVMMAMASAYAITPVDDRPWIRSAWIAIIIAAFVPGVLAGLAFVKSNDLDFALYPRQTDAGRNFLKEARLWQAVRAVTPVADAVANNPSDLSSLTLWPGDIGWALLAHRRHCAVSGPYLWAFRPAGLVQSKTEALFARVFSGQSSDGDLRTLRDTFLCKTLVVTPKDRLWTSALLAKSQVYKIVTQTDAWKIFRAN